MDSTLFIMVLLPDVTSGIMAFTCWKLEKGLLQIFLLVALIIFREYDSIHQQFLTNTNQCENKH